MVRRFRPMSVWQEMDRLQRDMNRILERPAARPRYSGRGFPTMNIWATADHQIITAEIPGVSPDEVEITMLGQELTLKGERKTDELPEDSKYHRQERGVGEFVRSIQLPFLVDADLSEASFDNGVLTIKLARSEADRPKKIAVRSN